MNKLFTLLLIIGGWASSLQAQDVVLIDYKTQRFIGEVSTLDRSKYLNFHGVNNNENDAAFNAFKEAYNIPAAYRGSRQFWSPLSKVNNGQIPNVRDNYNGVREVHGGRVGTGRESKLFHDETVDYSKEDVSELSKHIADYIARSYRDEWDPMPEYIEPFNEPMVHANEYYPEWRESKKYVTEKTDVVITKICEFHRDLGQAIHNTPELANLKVMGYASAFPKFEQNDFDLWRKRYAKFIDIAGEDVDVFSVHLYDSSGEPGINNSGGKRSGSNTEAILDLIETYSFIKLGVVKPLAVTEYGRLVNNQPNWANGNGEHNYEPVENAQAVRSQLHMVMSFMNRADHFEVAIPFNTDQRDPTTQFSKATLWTTVDGQVELTSRKYFYEMLKDIKGERVRVVSSNVDVQTQAFASGSELYVMLNNLNPDPQTVELQMVDADQVFAITTKRLKVFADKVPEFTVATSTSAPEALSLDYGETVVLTYSFSEPIAFTNSIRSKKYYANTYLQPIVANQATSFAFDGVDTGEGEAWLRVGVGRAHGLSLAPDITINGSSLPYSGDVIRGYDQKNRDQFFGTLEIPVPLDLLQQGANEVSVSFSDNGGYVSSVILQVEKAEYPVEQPEHAEILGAELPSSQEVLIYPNPVTTEKMINVLSDAEIQRVKVYALDGQLVKHAQGKRVDVSGLGTGLYILEIQTINKRIRSKLMVE